ncbi:MAG: hypothetical protein L0Z70_16705, partial [Chloroflexi bacterium]|nr:hypothetical protein [Chloroflexota bacterium]
MTRSLPLMFVILIILAAACGRPAAVSPIPVQPTVDTQATVNAAIAATGAAQANATAAAANVQATIDAAVAATAAAQPPTPTAGPTVEYVEMTEEELEALINQAVNEAVAESTAAGAAATQASADNTVTQEEVDTVEVVVTGAEEAIAYANELVEAYYALYGELAVESVQTLLEIEQELEAMAESMAVVAQALVEIETALAQGQAVAQAAIDQLTNAAQQVNNLHQAVNKLQEWLNKTPRDRDNRANQTLAIGPDANAPTDLRSTLAAAFGFVDEIRAALGDNKLSRDELNRIAQLGANASAGLNAHGGPQLQGLSGRVNEIVGQLARGQVSRARKGLGDFENLLGARPADLPR